MVQSNVSLRSAWALAWLAEPVDVAFDEPRIVCTLLSGGPEEVVGYAGGVRSRTRP